MLKIFKKEKQKGIIPIILAIILAGIALIALIAIAAFIAWLGQLVAGLTGGGDQPGGNSNIGCHLEGPDVSKATSQQTKTFSLTAFYHPVQGQTKYEQGSYEAELRMEGGDSGASGIKLEKGAIAAPPSYPFGTEIDISGFGRGVVVDRGCAIQEAGVPSTCPSLANPITKYDHLDLFTGEGDTGRMAMDQWNGKQAQGTVYYFNFVNSGNINDYVKIICQNAYGSSGSGFNNVPLFKQCDPRWRSNGYNCSGKTICSSGCGTTSAAMVLSFYGKSIDPAVTTSESLANGYRVCDGGTSAGFFSFIAKKYGLKEQDVDFDTAMQALKQGKPVIAAMSDSMFSSGGHYIVLTGIASNGMVMINDPGPRNVTQATQNDVRSAWSHGHLITP